MIINRYTPSSTLYHFVGRNRKISITAYFRKGHTEKANFQRNLRQAVIKIRQELYNDTLMYRSPMLCIKLFRRVINLKW